MAAISDNVQNMNMYTVCFQPTCSSLSHAIDGTGRNRKQCSKLRLGHFTVMDGSEGEGDLVLIQTFFALLWKLFLKNNSQHKNNLIYIIKQKGLYQNKVTLSLASTHNFDDLFYDDYEREIFLFWRMKAGRGVFCSKRNFYSK